MTSFVAMETDVVDGWPFTDAVLSLRAHLIHCLITLPTLNTIEYIVLEVNLKKLCYMHLLHLYATFSLPVCQIGSLSCLLDNLSADGKLLLLVVAGQLQLESTKWLFIH